MLRVYGEEKFAGRIASAIIRERERARITSSARLAELVRESHSGTGPTNRVDTRQRERFRLYGSR